MINPSSNPELVTLISMYMFFLFILAIGTSIIRRVVPIIVAIFYGLILIMLPECRWSMPIIYTYLLLLLLGIAKCSMVEAVTNSDFSKNKIRILIPTIIITIFGEIITIYLLTSNGIIILKDLSIFTTFIMFILIAFLIYNFLFIFLFQCINPLISLEKTLKRGSVLRFYEVYGRGHKSRPRPFYGYCVRFSDDNTYYFVNKKQYIDFKLNKGVEYEYIVNTGLLGIKFVTKMPIAITEINQTQIESNIMNFAVGDDSRIISTLRTIFPIVFGILAILTSIFMYFAFFIGYVNNKIVLFDRLSIFYIVAPIFIIGIAVIAIIEGIKEHKRRLVNPLVINQSRISILVFEDLIKP